MDRKKILVADDDAVLLSFLGQVISEGGYQPVLCHNGQEALAEFRRQRPDLVVTDLDMPNLPGMELLAQLKAIDESVPVIMITGYGTIETAVEAIKQGAFDFIAKPVHPDEICMRIERALETRRLRDENRNLRNRQIKEIESQLLGDSPAMTRLRDDIRRVAPTSFTVIIQGETGTGKELVANAIHALSPRWANHFVPVDCGTVHSSLVESELFGHERGAFTGADRARAGKFELAQGGTLFLDEVQNLSPEIQIKLLRALQERKICRVGGDRYIDIDLRVVVASNQNLSALCDEQSFRLDLFHRLNEFIIHVPPLRERGEDVILLANHFMEQAGRELNKTVRRLTASALDALTEYRWPGNVRELRNTIRRAVLLCDSVIDVEHLGIAHSSEQQSTTDTSIIRRTATFVADPAMSDDDTASDDLPLKEIVRRHVERLEREVILRTLKKTNFNKAQAARLLQIDYKTMQTKTREYGLTPAANGSEH